MSEPTHDVPWTQLMGTVHDLITDVEPDCPDYDDDESLCSIIASGLWLDGWKQAAPPTAVDAVVAAARAYLEHLSAETTRDGRWFETNQVRLDTLASAVREMGEQR